MSTHFQTVLAELAAAFTTGKRASDGATYYHLKDDEHRWCSRSWLTSATMREVHEAVDGPRPRLPDDWIYEQASRVADALYERNVREWLSWLTHAAFFPGHEKFRAQESARDLESDRERAHDAISEIADSLVDIYTHDLLTWLGNHHNASIADDAARDGMVADDASIAARAAAGQYRAIEAIAGALIAACESEADRRDERDSDEHVRSIHEAQS